MGARLVRDHSDSLPWRFPEAKKGIRGVKSHAEHVALLQAKLLEEVGEFIAASTDEERLTEAADVLQVIIDSILLGDSADQCTELREVDIEIQAKRRQKLARAGGFLFGTVWEV